MAAGKSSRPKKTNNMLSGLNNISGKAQNFVDVSSLNTEENPIEKTTEKINQEPEKTEEIKEQVKTVLESTQVVENVIKEARKKTKTEEAKKFTVYIPEDNYIFLKKNGWEYNGMNGFINHLIEEERKRREE